MAIFRVIIKDDSGEKVFCQKADSHDNAIFGALRKKISKGTVVNVECLMISSGNYMRDSFGNKISFAQTKRDIESINNKKPEWSFRETLETKR